MHSIGADGPLKGVMGGAGSQNSTGRTCLEPNSAQVMRHVSVARAEIPLLRRAENFLELYRLVFGSADDRACCAHGLTLHRHLYLVERKSDTCLG